MDIAIVGLGCRFPQARHPLAYWELVRSGTVTFRPIPASRWHHATFYDPSTRVPDKAYIDRGAYLDDDELREFGALHFGIPPRRIQVTDPQQRLLLDAVRMALQDAGYETRHWERGRAGVFVGASVSEHKEILLSRVRAQQLFDGAFGRATQGDETAKLRDALVENVVPMRAFSMAGNLLNMSAAVVAQQLDLGGPALSIDAACSSALVAAQQAVVNLRANQIDLAIAGGVYLNLLPDNLVSFSRIGAISRSGRCKPFDAKADGFVMGEGVGCVVLKRREDAERDGDRIYALLRGASANNDGRSEGPMTPRQGGQLEALRLAYRDAGVSPLSVGYVETHGTATTVGDVVEVGALQTLWREAGWQPGQPRTALGSVKANIGHCMSAAGIAGLIKASLALHRGVLPPQPSVDEENPKLELGQGPFFLPRAETPWESDGPRRAGVSSFGFGGTNAHLVLEEAPRPARRRPAQPAPRRAELFVLSASRPGVLARTARELAASLPQLERSGAGLPEIALSLARRAPADARLAFAAESFGQLSQRLLAGAAALEAREAALDPLAPAPAAPLVQLLPGLVFAQGTVDTGKVAVLFPGQGAQKVGLLREAYAQLPSFRARLDALDDALGPDLHAQLGGTLRSFLYAEPSPEAEARLTATQVCQPAMAAVGLALWAVLEELGLKADLALGHSLGELAAAAAAGWIPAEDCVRLVAHRGLAMVGLKLDDPGAMASAAADRASVEAALAGIDGVVAANLNHPGQTVISGTTAGVKAAAAALEARGVALTPLEVSHAFHSPLMDGVARAFAPFVAAQPIQPTAVEVVSGITAAPYPSDPEAVRNLWLRHATAPVDFLGALHAAAAAGARTFVQVGAGGVLTSFVRASLPEGERKVNVALASRDDDGLAQLAFAVGTLWTAGLPLKLETLFEGRALEPALLPPSLVETQPYWAVERPTTPREPLSFPSAGERAPAAPRAQETDMDPLVSLFREQVALLAQQARVLEQQAQALSARGVSPEAARAVLSMAPALAALPAPTTSSPVAPTASVAPPAPGAPPAAEPAAHPITPKPDVARAVLASVSRISAFPVEAIQPSQTLAGDLGFDSLMTVELDGDINKAFPGAGGLPRSLLGPQTTVQDVVEHLSRAVAGPRTAPSPMLSAALGAVANAGPSLSRFSPALVEVPLGPLPAVSPLPGALLLTRDAHGVAEALAVRLSKAGCRVAVAGAETAPASKGHAAYVCLGASEGADLVAQGLEALGPGFGVVHLAPLGRVDLDVAQGFEPLVGLHRLARAHAGMLVGVTARGGKLGLAGAEAVDAAVAGYLRALSREREGELVKCIDLAIDDGSEAMAEAIFAELQSGNAAPEVGFARGLRSEPELQPAAPGEPLALGPTDVVLVTGGSRGVGLRFAATLARSGCGIALVGRGAPDAAALETIRKAGGRPAWVQWDVTRPAGEALDEARRNLGAFTALVHAAGISEDGPVSERDEASLLRVLLPKLAGLDHALVATARDPLRLAVLVSSWAGRFGNAGQTGYAAANAALSNEALLLPRRRPGLHALALELPPWEGTAMVEKIPALARSALAEQGVPFIDDAQGSAALSDALGAGVAGPILVAPSRPARTLSVRSHLRVSRAQHTYLEDHQLAGQPVLPLASALDLTAHAAIEAERSGSGALLVRDFRLRHAVRIPDAADLTLLVSGDARAHGERTVALVAPVGTSGRRSRAYTGFFSVGADVAPALASAVPAPAATEAPKLPMTLDEFYGGYTFHGPSLRAIESIEQMGPQGIVGWVRTSRPADLIRATPRAAWTVDPLALDGAFQLAAYWAWSHLQRAGFPVGIEEFVQVAPLPEGTVRATLTMEQSAGDSVRGTIVLQSRDGKVLALARGVEGEFKHRDPRFLRGRGGAAPARLEAPRATAASTAKVAPAAPVAIETPAAIAEELYKIELFPEVQELEQRLGLAEAFGLKNPYFNVHERVTNDTSVVGGRTMINWSSYNYLGLSGDAQVTRAAQAAVERYGTSVSASRVASGEKPLHRELEQTLAAFLGTEDSVVTVSGHGVFVTVIATLLKDGDLVLHDALAHDCILAGARLSGAKRRPFPHGDWQALEKQLQQLRPHYKRVLIAIEGVYSMDGDIPDLPRFIELKKKYGAMLLVDEAHSIGVLGRTGRGIGEHFGVNPADVDLWMGTMSKSMASCGGYVGGSKALVQFLKYSAGGFVYSVGISPANAAAALEALRQLQLHPEKVERLHERAGLFVRLAKERGIDTGLSAGSAVVPAILGNSMHALLVSDALKQRGINVQPILYPAVEETAARLRFFVTATHSEQQIRETVEVLAEEIAKVRASDGQELETAG